MCEKLELVSLEVEEVSNEEDHEETEDPTSLLKRSIRRNSYHNPLTNAEIVIDESKTLFPNHLEIEFVFQSWHTSRDMRIAPPWNRQIVFN